MDYWKNVLNSTWASPVKVILASPALTCPDQDISDVTALRATESGRACAVESVTEEVAHRRVI